VRWEVVVVVFAAGRIHAIAAQKKNKFSQLRIVDNQGDCVWAYEKLSLD
jgi:phosphomevalonate kinase